MSKKTVYAPHLGREIRFGCKVEHIATRHALAMRHLTHETLMPPAVTGFAKSAILAPLLAQVFLNDQLGDCIIAARARRIGLLTGNARGIPFIYSTQHLDTEYGRVGGYVVGDLTTDNGCDPTVSADDGVKNGYADGSRDAGWVTVDTTNKSEVMLANFVTNGACDLSMSLPDAWVTKSMPRKNGDVWDVAGEPDPNNGHCVAVVDHDAAKGLLVDTWGLLVWVTWEAVARYGRQANGGVLIAHVNRDVIAESTHQAPNGFDWSTLLAYFDQDLGGHATIPALDSGPGPSTDPVAVTLVQAQTWAAGGVARGPVLMTRQGAIRRAADGLAASWPR